MHEVSPLVSPAGLFLPFQYMPDFPKKPLSHQDQLKQLIARGLTVNDEAAALEFLKHKNYYRLSGYWLPFEASRNPHRFKKGVSFDEIISIYAFDESLRALLFETIGKFEVSFRSIFAYYLAMEKGPHAHLYPDIVKSHTLHKNNLNTIKQQLKRANEKFIKHHRVKYGEDPPVWVTVEILSFGAVSKLYKNIKQDSIIKRRVAGQYKLDARFLESVLQNLSEIRNVCAHHGRLWNRKLTSKLREPLIES